MKNEVSQHIIMCFNQALLPISSFSGNEDDAKQSRTIAIPVEIHETARLLEQAKPYRISPNLPEGIIISIDDAPDYLKYNQDTKQASWTKA